MWIVNLALRRPYTFIVLGVFISIAGVLSILSTPKDIFPSINIPVISVIWTYTGMAPKDIADNITSPYERALTTTVDNIEHIESESLYGIAIVKIFLQPHASVPQGVAQVTSISQAILKQLATGITPPLVLSYSASNVPVLMVGLSGLSEQQLNDYGLNFVRTQLITVSGAAVPYPYGVLIIAISIPLAILASVAVLSALGETINIMTLGGLALAVGILVDDATVTIENIDRHLAQGKPALEAIRDGAGQIATPALVSTLCICIVFVPIFLHSGVAKYLFAPLAVAVIFAMIASYILSRTLVPTLAMYWMKEHGAASPTANLETAHHGKPRKGFPLFAWFSGFHRWFNRSFEKFREGYRDLLSLVLRNAGKLVILVLGFAAASSLLYPFLGQNFFPSVDTGEFEMHVRTRAGTRIEETARTVDLIELL